MDKATFKPIHDATHNPATDNVNSFSLSQAGLTSLLYRNLSLLSSASVFGSTFPSYHPSNAIVGSKRKIYRTKFAHHLPVSSNSITLL